ncbi:MAG TPA: 2-amino-4-hydroxy-6-hydroxymethyldihydropteridine diphosphokinase [Actinomycetota bacterium]|nr:2-amino-4-hydroxy-6-hydroxymethyldihydropteridine diphosphokinase [Actinomycetota bacterium]
MATTAYLGLGSNLGDRLGNLQAAVDGLHEADGVRVVASSRVWETAPVGPPQPDYLNAVVRVETDLSPADLLGACRRVEEVLGRVRRERWGARTIDVDVLLFDARTVDEPDLVVPHPRLTERAFVVLPLLELDPDPILPDGRRVRNVRLDTDGAAPFAPPLVVRP